MIEYKERDSYRIPTAATIALKLLCDALHEAKPDAKFFVTVSMSENGVDSFAHTRIEMTEAGDIEYLDDLQLTSDGFTRFKTHILHQSDDGEDFIIASFSCLHGELSPEGYGEFTAIKRYYSLRDIQALGEAGRLAEEVKVILKICK